MKKVFITIFAIIIGMIMIDLGYNFVEKQKKINELYKITDSFVELLDTRYSSYGLLGGMDYIKLTQDKEYQVFPINRLINVKIMHYADKKEYEKLQKKLQKHYKNNKKVREVYICNAGTLMIDCRR